MRKVSLIACIVLAVSLFSGTSFAAYLVDGPGTVKTTNILDGAVTTSKLASNAVTTAKLADNAVTTTKILDSAVTSTKIANGAITDVKISGLISASKISSAGLNADTVDGKHASDLANAVHTHAQADVTGLQAALAGKSDVTHNHDTLYQQKYGKVAVVAQTGGDYADPITAMNNSMAWCGTASATNPCLLKIMPGVYPLSDVLNAKSYIDIEGSGKMVTKLLGMTSYYFVTNSELRDLSIEGSYIQIQCWSSTATFSNINVTLTSPSSVQAASIDITNGGQSTFKNINILLNAPGVPYGVRILRNGADVPTLNDVTITALNNSYPYGLGYGIVAISSDVRISNLRVNSNGGLRYSIISQQEAGGLQSNITIHNGYFLDPITTDGSSTISAVGLQSPYQGDGVAFKCVNCYDLNFHSYPNQ